MILWSDAYQILAYEHGNFETSHLSSFFLSLSSVSSPASSLLCNLHNHARLVPNTLFWPSHQLSSQILDGQNLRQQRVLVRRGRSSPQITPWFDRVQSLTMGRSNLSSGGRGEDIQEGFEWGFAALEEASLCQNQFATSSQCTMKPS